VYEVFSSAVFFAIMKSGAFISVFSVGGWRSKMIMMHAGFMFRGSVCGMEIEYGEKSRNDIERNPLSNHP
jgi:hypothetical protein